MSIYLFIILIEADDDLEEQEYKRQVELLKQYIEKDKQVFVYI